MLRSEKRPIQDATVDTAPTGANPPATTIRTLLSYRLHTVANLLSRGASMRYRREFGVSLWEWRTIALLGAPLTQGTARGPALSLNELAKAAGLDKSQMSRVVSGLAERGLIVRASDAADARGVRLSLSRTGAKLYRGLIAAAAERNAAFLACLDRDEHAVLERALAKLGGEARKFIAREQALAPRKAQ